MGCSSKCWVWEGRGHCCNHGDSSSKFPNKVIFCKIKNLRAEDRPIVINRLDNQTVREWSYQELRKKGSRRGFHFVTLLNELYRGDDFDSAFVDLGWDVERLKINYEITAKIRKLMRKKVWWWTWKKEVWDGSSPVFPGGTTTSVGAIRPTRAGAPTYSSLETHEIRFSGYMSSKK